jgi:hypothetical protein
MVTISTRGGASRLGAGWAVLPAALLLHPLPAAGQAEEGVSASFTVEIRAELRDYFPGPFAEGDEGTWRASYVESGEWVFALEPSGSVELSGGQGVDDLEASARPILVDGCGNQWVREWQDPARVEWESEVRAELVLADEAVAVWYRPIRASLVDPGGPRGKGDCYDPDEEDEAGRADLVFDPSDLRQRADTESGLPAVRGDGFVLLALIPLESLVAGDEVTRRVRYGDARMGFRARVELRPF